MIESNEIRLMNEEYLCLLHQSRSGFGSQCHRDPEHQETKSSPFDEHLVAGGRFNPNRKPVLREGILAVLRLNGPLSVREICSLLGESNSHRVRMTSKRL